MSEEKQMGWTTNLAEPKRGNRFELLLENELRLTCYSVAIPGIKVEEVAIDRMHEKFYVAGSKVTYDSVKVEFYDFVDNDASLALKEWYASIYSQRTSRMGYPAEYKRDVTLIVYGPDHSIRETWLFIGAFPLDLAYGQLDWKNGTEVRHITATLRIDQAKLTLS